MDTGPQTRHRMYGLFEIDAAGTVTYSRLEGESQAQRPHPELDGRNLFSEAAPFLNAEELRRVVNEFRAGNAPAKSITFTCLYEDGQAEQVRVLLARMREQSGAGHTKSVLMHIRKGS